MAFVHFYAGVAELLILILHIKIKFLVVNSVHELIDCRSLHYSCIYLTYVHVAAHFHLNFVKGVLLAD